MVVKVYVLFVHVHNYRVLLQLPVPEGFQPRFSHSLTATSLAPGITVATAFGGWRNLGDDLIAETTLLQFGEYYDCPPCWFHIAHCSEAGIIIIIVCFRSTVPFLNRLTKDSSAWLCNT